MLSLGRTGNDENENNNYGSTDNIVPGVHRGQAFTISNPALDVETSHLSNS